jgi:hypothetical protein
MAATVAKMTKLELKEIIESTVERKLMETLGDPDEGLDIGKSQHDRLLRQRASLAAGQRGRSLASVARRLKLDR